MLPSSTISITAKLLGNMPLHTDLCRKEQKLYERSTQESSKDDKCSRSISRTTPSSRNTFIVKINGNNSLLQGFGPTAEDSMPTTDASQSAEQSVLMRHFVLAPHF
jgi:hypothetical protein